MDAGLKIRDYLLEELIGEGGVGEVWRAHHPRLKRPGAIKVILPHLFRDQNIHSRFLQEAVNMANLRHPHIVRIYDFFSFNDNEYLVMDYIEGGSLQGRLARLGRLPLADALQISRDILSALDFAHQKLIIHRDVKPSNILLAADSRAYLADFGIALVLGRTRITRFGTNVGTLEYMSPEQIRGEELNHKTDVYSFGCVLYEMLAGRPPFGTLGEVTEYTLMGCHIDETPKPLRDLNAEVDEHTESVVMRALSKERNDRFDGCAQMSVRLARGAPSRKTETPSTNGKRSLTLKIAAGVLGLTTAIFGLLYAYKGNEETRSLQERNRSLEGSNRELLSNVNNLEATKSNLEVRNGELDTEVGELSRTVKNLQGTIINLERKIKQRPVDDKGRQAVSLYWVSTMVKAASLKDCVRLADKAMRDLEFQDLRQSSTDVAGAGRGTYAAITCTATAPSATAIVMVAGNWDRSEETAAVLESLRSRLAH
jgi:serine/threonine protein kinase